MDNHELIKKYLNAIKINNSKIDTEKFSLNLIKKLSKEKEDKKEVLTTPEETTDTSEYTSEKKTLDSISVSQYSVSSDIYNQSTNSNNSKNSEYHNLAMHQNNNTSQSSNSEQII